MNKPDSNINHIKIIPTGMKIPKGKKHVWVAKYKLWLEVDINKDDKSVISTFITRYEQSINNTIIDGNRK